MSSVNLDELLHECNLKSEDLDVRITTDRSREISRCLTKWKDVARKLSRFDENEIHEIDTDNRFAEDKKYDFLERFKQKYATCATYKLLVEKLLEIERADDALNLCKVVPRATSHGNKPGSSACIGEVTEDAKEGPPETKQPRLMQGENFLSVGAVGTDPSTQPDSCSANGASAKTSPAIKTKGINSNMELDGGSAPKEHPEKVEAGLEVCFTDCEPAVLPQGDPKYYKKFGPNLKDAHDIGIKGKGIKLAIIDFFDGHFPNDGIQKEHEALRNAHWNTEIISKNDEHHQTDHALTCTTIAIGSSYDKGFYVGKNSKTKPASYPGGIAPEADTTLFLINSEESKCKEALLDALDQVAEKKFDVLSMSIVSKEFWMEEKIKKIHRNGTIIVAATGNGGIWDGIYQPASFEEVISVESFDTFGNKSEFTPKGDISFPGEIMAPVRDYSTGKELRFVKGTSMATPGIAGLVCLLLQCAKKHHHHLTKKNVLVYLDQMITTNGRDRFDKEMSTILIKAFTEKDFLKPIDH